MSSDIIQSNDYKNWAFDIVNKIKQAQVRTSLKVNAEMLDLYWEIGHSIIEKQNLNGWGSKVIELLSADLQKVFTDTLGFSIRNLKYMRAFAEAYSEYPFVQVPLAQNKNEMEEKI